jgi:hypothetical protein
MYLLYFFIANKLHLNHVYILSYVAVFLSISNVTISISCKRFTENKLHTYIQCHKSCSRKMLCARYLFFKRNAEKFGVRVIRKVRAGKYGNL